MKKLTLWAVMFAAMFGLAARAQDVTGDWQGTLHAGKDLRVIVRITKGDGKLLATMYSIDQGAYGLKASSVTLDGSVLKYTIDMMGGTYEGKVNAQGKLIAGIWTQGGQPLGLTLVKATAETAWEIPETPKPPALMAADADPSFDVATVKPNISAGSSMQQLTMNGRNFTIRNGSLGDLIAFAYDVQMKQIISAPDWMDQNRYDIDGVPDKVGAPSPQQLRQMMQKLLADRFALKFHKDKRDMSAFVLEPGKNGQKLKPTQMTGPLPGFGLQPVNAGVTMRVMNSTMDEFCSIMQMMVLDRPVVNHSALSGRFDFNLTFTPDDSQFKGHAPKLPQGTDAVASSPNLFDAVQEQLGMKLVAEKTAVDVIAIDHVEKPSAN